MTTRVTFQHVACSLHSLAVAGLGDGTGRFTSTSVEFGISVSIGDYPCDVRVELVLVLAPSPVF